MKNKYYIVAAIVGFTGSSAVVVADILGFLIVEKHNPISETISKLAIGKFAWIQDLGLDLFALAILLIALALKFISTNSIKLKLASFCLIFLAVDIAIIAEYNQYKGFDDFGGKVHTTCVYILYFLVCLSSLLVGLFFRSKNSLVLWSSFLCFGAWLVLGPIFMFLAADAWDGALERFIALFFVTWVGSLSWFLLKMPKVDTHNVPEREF